MEAPVREIVDEILRDHGFVGPAEVARLRGELAELKDRVTALESRLRDTRHPTPDT